MTEVGTTLAGTVGIVTGGAQGIGYAYAERLLREGASVMIAEANAAGAQSAVESLSKLGPVDFVVTDVADEQSCIDSAEATIARFDRVDILINNAGLYGDMDFGDQSLEYLRKMHSINLHGSWLMIRAVAPHMVQGGGGRIVNVASTAAYSYRSGATDDYTQLPNFSYHTSKWGVVGLTKYAAGYLGRFNITVNCIAPGLIMTDATRKQTPTHILEMLQKDQPVPGAIQADDVAGAAAFLVGPDARFISGQVIVVDGGRFMPA